MVQVQSTWFPVYDRNPQKFVPNIFEAKEADYQKTTQHIYRSKQFPSSVEVSILRPDNPPPRINEPVQLCAHNFKGLIGRICLKPIQFGTTSCALSSRTFREAPDRKPIPQKRRNLILIPPPEQRNERCGCAVSCFERERKAENTLGLARNPGTILLNI